MTPAALLARRLAAALSATLAAAIAATFAASFAPGPAAAAEEVVAGLSRNTISITANFDGSDLLVYGAVKRETPAPADSALDVIVTVEGPSTPITVRRKARTFGIWVNSAAVEVDRAPSFYTVATTGPLHTILSHTEDLRRKISVPQMIRSVGAPQDISDSFAFTEALIRVREANGLYSLHEGTVELAEDTLFHTDVDLPANLVEGDYLTRFFLLRDRRVVAMGETVIGVRKVGLERWLYTLAVEEPAAYGILALALAALAGWAASTAFRLLKNG